MQQHDLAPHTSCHATGISTSVTSSDGNSVEEGSGVDVYEKLSHIGEGEKKDVTGLSKAEAQEDAGRTGNAMSPHQV